MHHFLTTASECRTMVLHRSSMFASKVGTGTAWPSPDRIYSSLVDASLGGAHCLVQLLMGAAPFKAKCELRHWRRPRVHARNRPETCVERNDVRGAALRIITRLVMRPRQSVAISMTYAINKRGIIPIMLNYRRNRPDPRQNTPPGPRPPGGSACATPHAPSPQILPPGAPIL